MENSFKFRYTTTINGIIEVPLLENKEKILEEAFDRLIQKHSAMNSKIGVSITFTDDKNITSVKTKKLDY